MVETQIIAASLLHGEQGEYIPTVTSSAVAATATAVSTTRISVCIVVAHTRYP